MAKNQNAYKIRVRLKSYDHRVIDEASRKILQTALSTGAKVVGPVPCPLTPSLLLFWFLLIQTRMLKSIMK